MEPTPSHAAEPNPQRHQRLIVFGMIAVLAGAAIFAIVAATGGSRNSPDLFGGTQTSLQSGSTGSTDPQARTKSELRNLATAEEIYLTDNDVYTNNAGGLAAEDFQRDPGDTSTLLAGFNTNIGYCLVGSPDGKSDWFLYSSEHGGLQESSYGTADAAEAACGDPAINDYAAV